MILILLFTAISNAQNYNNIVNYSIYGTPSYGVKIKTNLPFLPANQMPTITIVGYNYNTAEPINLTLVYYIYFNVLHPIPQRIIFMNQKFPRQEVTLRKFIYLMKMERSLFL